MSSDGARLLERHLPDIEQVVAHVCRRRGLEGDAADEFRSWLLARLVDNDYQILRSYRGDSGPRTYLTVVANRLYLDYRTELWGKWRPSAAAQRLGTLAVELEQLLVRDRMPLSEAAGILRSRREIDLSDRALAEMAAHFPDRSTRRPTDLSAEGLAAIPSDQRPDVALEMREGERRHREVIDRLGEALDSLPAEDHLLLKLRFFEGLTLASVARQLGVPQKPLYRRLDRTLSNLREILERRGVSRSEITGLLGQDLPMDPRGMLHREESNKVASVLREEAS